MSDVLKLLCSTAYVPTALREVARMKREFEERNYRWQGPIQQEPTMEERMAKYVATLPQKKEEPVPVPRVVKESIANSSSCVGCKFLYGKGDGYSNYTWMDTWIRCAKNANPNLAGDVDKPSDWFDNKDEPYSIAHDDMQWKMDNVPDNWPATKDQRCSAYQPGPYVELDVDGDVYPADKTDDWEQVEAIARHAGIAPSLAIMEAVRAFTGLERWEWAEAYAAEDAAESNT